MCMYEQDIYCVCICEWEGVRYSVCVCGCACMSFFNPNVTWSPCAAAYIDLRGWRLSVRQCLRHFWPKAHRVFWQKVLKMWQMAVPAASADAVGHIEDLNLNQNDKTATYPLYPGCTRLPVRNLPTNSLATCKMLLLWQNGLQKVVYLWD